MNTTPTFSPGQLAQLACLLEVTARKPGNVHRGADFADTHFLDFLLSASALVDPLDRAHASGIGRAVLEAVQATQRRVARNTNLGMILLLAPLAAIPDGAEPRDGVAELLARTTLDDARLVYRAIRLARPGGLGSSAEQDLRNEPTVSLRETMSLAADRDLVARQYANGFAEVFDVARPALNQALQEGRPIETAIIATHLTLMARCPDTLIARKRGPEVAAESSRKAADLLTRGWPETDPAHLDGFDAWLRGDDHARNPGATADLVAATLFLALRDGTIVLPLATNWAETPCSPTPPRSS